MHATSPLWTAPDAPVHFEDWRDIKLPPGTDPAAADHFAGRWSIPTLTAPLQPWFASAKNASRHCSSRNV